MEQLLTYAALSRHDPRSSVFYLLPYFAFASSKLLGVDNIKRKMSALVYNYESIALK